VTARHHHRCRIDMPQQQLDGDACRIGLVAPMVGSADLTGERWDTGRLRSSVSAGCRDLTVILATGYDWQGRRSSAERIPNSPTSRTHIHFLPLFPAHPAAFHVSLNSWRPDLIVGFWIDRRTGTQPHSAGRGATKRRRIRTWILGCPIRFSGPDSRCGWTTDRSPGRGPEMMRRLG